MRLETIPGEHGEETTDGPGICVECPGKSPINRSKEEGDLGEEMGNRERERRESRGDQIREDGKNNASARGFTGRAGQWWTVRLRIGGRPAGP